MSALLARPRIVYGTGGIVLPDLSLEASHATPGLPSPFAHISLQAELVQRLSPTFRALHDGMSLDSITAFRQTVQAWMDGLPEAYSTNNADTEWDDDFWYVDWQRRNLHVIGYLTMFHPLKAAFVMGTRTVLASDGLSAMAIECSSLLISASENLFKLIFPNYVDYHFTFFCVFEPAILLCSILENDHVDLPRRGLAIASVQSSLMMLETLKPVSKDGTALHAALAGLADRLTLSPKGKAPQLSYRNSDSPPKRPTQTSSLELSPCLDAGPSRSLSPSSTPGRLASQNRVGTRLNCDLSTVAVLPSPDSGGLVDPGATDQLRDRATSESNAPKSTSVSLPESPLMNHGVDFLEHLVLATTETSFGPVSNPLLLDSPRTEASVNMREREPFGRSSSSDGSQSRHQTSHPAPEPHHCPPATSYPLAPLLSGSFAKPVFDVFLETLLDSYGSRRANSSYWIQTGKPWQIWRAGTALVPSSPFVHNAYLAVSTTYYGLSIDDPRLIGAGERLYSSVLKSLQAALSHPEQSRSEAVLMTVALCGIYEVSAVEKRSNTVANYTSAFNAQQKEPSLLMRLAV